MKVCLDAGHGGKDPGACNGSYHEADAALNIVLQLGEYLRNQGVNVYYSRTIDIYPEWKTRVGVANDNNVELFVSIHLNSSDNKSASGTEVLIHPSAATNTRNLAKKVCDSIANTMGFKNRGVKERSDLYVLKTTNMPAILIETGFISNDEECKTLFDSSKQKLLVEAIGLSIYKWLIGVIQ